MRKVVARTVVLAATAVLLWVTVGSALEVPAQTVGEGGREAAVRALWSTLDATWNARDAERFSDLFTTDTSFEFVDRRQSLEGRATILQHFAERFPQIAPDVRHRTTVLQIRPIASDVIAVDGEVEISQRGTDENVEPAILRSFAIFAVMLRTTDGWRIHVLRAYQLSPAPSQTPLRGD